MPQFTDQVDHVLASGARCFECGSPMVRLEGKYDHFWVCTNDACGETFADGEGLPKDRTGSEAQRKRPRGRAHDG